MKFKSRSEKPIDALVVNYDLQGFSTFFNQPDVHTYVPVYLNHIVDAINTLLAYREPYWVYNGVKCPVLCGVKEDGDRRPVHRKFLGDGELLLFDMAKVLNRNAFIINMMNDFWNLASNFDRVNRRILDHVPVAELPTGIRFGLARGSVIELNEAGTMAKEYIGFPMNLASRLESYCRDLKVISSARIALPQKSLDKHRYKKVIANNIPGFPREVVIVDNDSYEDLILREDLFEEVIDW